MRFSSLLSVFLIIFVVTSINTSSLAKKAAIILDYKTGGVLFEINADTLNYPASLTKMKTLYIMFDYLENSFLLLRVESS